MAARRDIFIKWSLYALAALVLLFFDSLLFGSLRLWGVKPFLPPLLVVLPATYEEPWPSSLYVLCLGACCDLAFPAPFPFLYTLAFVLAAIAATLIAKYAVQPGFFCSVAATVCAFFILHLLLAAAFYFRGAGMTSIFSLGARETAVSCLLLLVCYPIFKKLRGLFDF